MPLKSAKENCNILQEKSAKSKCPARNPFSQLSDNILPQNTVSTQTIRKRVVSYRSVKTSEVKSRTNSANSVQVKEVRYFFKSENITERQGPTKTEENGENGDDVFVEGEQHFLNYLPEEKKTASIPKRSKSQDVENQIVQAVPVVRRSLKSQADKLEVRKPAQKVTLVRKLSSRHKRYKIEEFFKNCLYDLEYFEDNYHHMLDTEGNFVFRKNFLKKSTDEDYRMLVVNWLIYVQQILNLTEHTFFVAVRLFDYILASGNVACKKYILVGIVCMWIANKNIDVNFIKVPRLFALCDGKFSKEEIILTEREVLLALGFKVNCPEPANFLFYYLKRENLENNQKVLFSAMFLLENFTLLIDFSSLNPSLLAAMALYLVLVKYGYNSSSFVEYIKNHLLEEFLFKRKSDQMLRCVKYLLDNKGFTNEVVAKYSTEEKCRVAQDFIFS